MKALVVSAVMMGAAIVVFYSSEQTVLIDADTAPPAITQAAVLSSNAPLNITAADTLTALRTFNGAQEDGALRTDHKGRLIIDMQLRHWFDFYLSAQGELSLDEIKTILLKRINALPQPGQQQAQQLMDNYLGYLAALSDYDAEAVMRMADPDLSELAARLDWQQRLRREWLEPVTVAAFFGMEEEIDNYTLAAQRLRQQGAAAEAIEQLAAELPEPIQQLRAQSRQLLTMQQQEQQLIEQGAGSERINQWRQQQYGPEAAERLAALDQRKSQWQKKLKEYQEYKNSPAVQGLPEKDRARLLQTFIDKNFNHNEQKRVDAALAVLDL